MSSGFTLGAVGDICLSDPIAQHLRNKDASWLFKDVQPELARANLLFGNMESVILPPEFPDAQIDPRGLVSKVDGSRSLREAGFGFLNLANNHILDGGYTGLFHTQRMLESAGIATGGVGRTQEEARKMRVIRCRDLSVGFLCYADDSDYTLGAEGPCHAFFSKQTALEDIARCRPQVDVLVVSIHGDLEFMETPSLPRREVSRELVRAGATVLLEHHPHVPQGVEMVGNSLIAYSLGNFCFPSHTDPYTGAYRPRTTRSFILLAEISKNGVTSFTRIPVEIQPPPDQTPSAMTGESRTEMLGYLAALDEMVADDALVQSNWRRAAQQQYDKHLRRMMQMRNPEAVRHTFARLLFVEEFRPCMEEIYKMLREEWSAKDNTVDPHHRPGFAYMHHQQLPAGGFARFKQSVRRTLKAFRRNSKAP